ncbi:hypothetical protein [Cytobacillus firmus]|uniref:hypothetical protein n=1 Tax=Cytobacillus firmus TaxID=1399 RepID=UPI0018CE102F|nr:hypothetical protein [Cytobacillus firmus]
MKEAREESLRLKTEIQELKLNLKPLQDSISLIPTHDPTFMPIHRGIETSPSPLETTNQIITETTETLNMLIEKGKAIKIRKSSKPRTLIEGYS